MPSALARLRRPAVFAAAMLLLPILAPRLGAAAEPPAAMERLQTAADGARPAVRLAARAPVNFPMETTPRCDILDNFGDPRSGGRTHQGIDIMATLGQDVYAMADGTLTLQTFAGTGGGSSLSGNLWELTATNGTAYIYAHLASFAPGLARGATVYAGQLIGWVGDTGNAGAGNYHLHFEIHPGGGTAVDPLPRVTVPPACRVF